MAQKLIDKLQTPKAIKWFWILLASPVALILLLLLLIGIGVFGKLPTSRSWRTRKVTWLPRFIRKTVK